MADLLQFPASARAHNNRVLKNQAERKQLAEWFRALAMHIESNEIEHEPLAAMVVLSSPDGDEVINMGYQRPEVNLQQAGNAAMRWGGQSFRRRGGNFFDRIK